MSKYISKFWLSFTAIITFALLFYLFPQMLARYGIFRAILLSLILIAGMCLAYIRGYIIASLLYRRKIEKSGKQ
ncbi:MAG TPA: hypothetical protein ENH25_01170 [candidate division Zixibacteria bacterium]|nr:hypothetical protein [candidate division Zixibacteria bacterium]